MEANFDNNGVLDDAIAGLAADDEVEQQGEVQGGGNEPQPQPAQLQPLEGPPFRKDDPARMQLTNEERQWALSIRAAIEANNEIDPVSDFKCVHLAIIFQGDVEAAVESALHLQCFRHEYDILDTLSESRRALAKLIKLFPKYYMSYSFNKEDGDYYLVYDITQFSIKKMTRTEMFTTFNAGSYYFLHATTVDFALMRKGSIFIAECEGYSWTQHVDKSIFQKVWFELVWAYPVRHAVKAYNTGVMFNVFLSTLKKLLPAESVRKYETGYRFEGRLDSIYMVPTVEAANQKLLHNLDHILQRRYDLEKSFSLSDLTTVDN
ncbi:expressed unknown protein [Seminavis robusta]|uniref:Uncharacterized protein n=1 Tax=Seminavis robusta TaxID=568900 RepID=A0A9N8H6B9_9STRA|nr:expressed unknown protein [Seminavis robusta]|eukprot:Sro107_g054030.1 n/a (320) ;mRNA; f:104859-105818